LHQAYPMRIDFGNLDYSSSDPVEVQIDWVYTNFTCEMKSIMVEDNKELDFLYFNDFERTVLGKPNTELTCEERFKQHKKLVPSATYDDFAALRLNEDCRKGDDSTPEPGSQDGQVGDDESKSGDPLNND